MNGDNKGVPDFTIALAALMLLSIGLVLIYSSSAILALSKFGDSYHYIRKQLFFVLLGAVALVPALGATRERLRAAAGPLMAACLVLLAAVLVPGLGSSGGGARRWLTLGFFGFQPSEIAKLAFVLFAADRLTRPAPAKVCWEAGAAPVLGVAAAMALLLMREPDFGSAVFVVAVALGMLFCSGLNFWVFALPFLAAAPAAYFFVTSSPYRMRRIAVFLDPWKDPQGSGFQIIHSLMAFGEGGLLGKGLGEGRQKLFYLPEPHTDFIFSTAGEEFGFLGCVTIVSLFAVLVWRGMVVAVRAKDDFVKLASAGLSLMLGLQVLINLFVVLGMAPTKGTTLPFLSSGGSALVVDLAAVGLLLNLSRQKG